MDYFETLSQKEIKENRKLLEEFERLKIEKNEPEIEEISKKHKKEKINIDDMVNFKPSNTKGELFKIGFDKLNEFQKPIVKECCDKGFGGLSLKVGSGKTIVSIVIELYLTRNTNQPLLE